ncbi:MAG: hypothetical protein ACKOE8_05850 [Opitutaceae bacterium]
MSLISRAAFPSLLAFTLCAGRAASPPVALPALPAWSTFASVESVFGYKDNLLLSASGEERSALARGTAEILLMRTPTQAFEYSVFAQAEGTRFLEGETVRNESRFWFRQELGWRPGPQWELHLPVTGYFDDRVFDQSDTEVERITGVLRVLGAMAGPTLRWDFHRSAWLEANAAAQRDVYADGSNDGWTRHAGLRINLALRRGWEAGVGANSRWRAFDAREQYSASGRVLPGTSLRSREDKFETRLSRRWGTAEAWRAVLRCSFVDYRDNGSGYFDRREWQVEPEVDWRPAGWRLQLRAAARRVEFGVQTVGVGLNPAPRIRDEYEAEFRAERKFSARWSVIGGFRWERARSNERVASYVVNEGLLGARWSWEK